MDVSYGFFPVWIFLFLAVQNDGFWTFQFVDLGI